MISQKTIAQIFETAKIEEVVGDFVNLKRRGVNMIGLCPFHDEKTPSFTVSPTKNICKCFGCGKGGSPVNFLMEVDNLTYPEALRVLAGKYGIEIEEDGNPDKSKEQRQHQESLYLINQFTKDFFIDQMNNTDIGKSVGLHYFKDRGFREEIIERFGLGYAPSDGKSLMHGLDKAGYEKTFYEKLGVVKNGRDFFRGRVMFPIHNLTGKCIGFGGRILKANKKAPKYVNSSEAEIYNKSKVLYGMYFAKNEIRKKDECILVEGYTDTISLHQAGIENVVASSGTSLTIEQIRLIKRFTPNIKILYDGDAAGVKAALRGLDLVLEQDLNVKVVLLPEGEDPDSYAQSIGTEAFVKYLDEKATDFILFKMKLLMEEAKDDPVKRSDLIKDIVNSISKIPDPIKRSVYIRECARQLDVGEKVLINAVNKNVVGNIQSRQRQQEINERRANRNAFDEAGFPIEDHSNDTSDDEFGPPDAHSDSKEFQTIGFQEKDIARILVNFGDREFNEDKTIAQFIFANIGEILDTFETEPYKAIVQEYLEAVKNKKSLSPQHFLNHQDQKIRDVALNFNTSPYEYSPGWLKRFNITTSQPVPDENFINDTTQALMRFKLEKVKELCEQNNDRIKAISMKDHPETVKRYLQVQMKLNGMRKEITDQLNTVVP